MHRGIITFTLQHKISLQQRLNQLHLSTLFGGIIDVGMRPAATLVVADGTHLEILSDEVGVAIDAYAVFDACV